MAKSSGKTGGTSRIRFIMVDAEIADGDIHSVTQAITNALKGPDRPAAMKRLSSVPATNGAAEPVDVDGEFEDVDDEPVDVTPVFRSPAKKRVGPKPTAIELDVDSDVSLASYAAKYNPGSNHKRYLVIAAWLHNCRQIDTITADHIYTCYRHLQWPLGISDFAQPLRELKHKQFFTSPERGKYSIHQLGLAEVAKLNGGGE
jgi:hypothetical protein